MESRTWNDFYVHQWTVETKSCIERMEPYDRRTIRSFRTHEDVEKHIFRDQDEEVSEAALQELAVLEPPLVDLKNFSDFFAAKLGPTLDTSTLWGLLGLLLTVVLQHDNARQRIVQMLKKLSRNCHDFMLHCQQTFAINKEDKESCFEICVMIIKFLADAVLFLRQADDDLTGFTSRHGTDDTRWTELTKMFNSTISEIEDTLSRVERVAAIYERQYRGDKASWFSYLSLSSRAFSDTASLPCIVLPPMRTGRFFDREDVIEKIEKHFHEGGPGISLRSLALYGMGGVGKSHVALRYLEIRQTAEDLQAVFWVNAESPLSIQQSFTDIALRLKLPDTGPANHDENRMIFKGWLHQTKCNWILVYDNAETSELLQDYWPLSGSNGRVLITTRNHSLSFDPADTGLEILPWDTNTGSRFLLHLLAGHVSAELLANESQSAYSLSERLSGHALALSNMCGLLHRRSWSISELIEVYDKSKDFKDGLERVWQMSFKSLQPDSAALLSIFAFCSPDSIPQSLFELQEDVEDLTTATPWYLDSDRLSTATEELLTLALVKRDRSQRVFSIHRLIADQFRRFLDTKNRHKGFSEASILLYNAFPKRSKTAGTTRANLYNVWDRCQLWLQHVLQLKSSFMQERKRDPSFSACKETCETWVQCQRFLLETQNWRELEDLVTVNRIAMATLPEPDKEIYLLSATEVHVSSMWAFRGQFKLALESLRAARRLKLSELPNDLQSICWIEDNLATIHGCLRDFDTANEWIEGSCAIWKRWSESTDVEFKLPPLLMLTHGRILIHGGRLDEGRVQLSAAIDGFLSADPFVWAPTANCKFTIGRLLMFEGKYDAAESMLTESQTLWLQGDKSRALDFNGIIVYHLGCCALSQGNIDVAIGHLQDAKVISSIHKNIHPAKYARCLFKLSDALRRVSGREAEAEQYLREAEELYYQVTGMLQSTTTTIREEDFDALIHISQR